MFLPFVSISLFDQSGDKKGGGFPPRVEPPTEMLRRRQQIAPVVAAGTAIRTYFNCMPDPIGKVHPDVLYGYMQTSYRGRGWANLFKVLPTESFTGALAGGGPQSYHQKMGQVQDPEDPRHPIVRYQIGGEKGIDGSVHDLKKGYWGPIPEGSRLLQVLYANYLEPFSCNRVPAHLRQYEKVPNHCHEGLKTNCDYVGETASLVGTVLMAMGTVVMEGAVLRADQNQIYIHEGVQIMENVQMTTDAPTTLHHYQRGEMANPYQTIELMEGVVRILMNAVIEPNCIIESCQIGPFNRIGHNTKIMKGVSTGVLVWIMPGSVVLQNTHIHDGELWGGAPARKLGKVSKFEWKKPWFHSILHREMTAESHLDRSRYGDQVALYQEALDKLTVLMVDFEHDVSEGVKAQVKDFVLGREPYEHAISRITQAGNVRGAELADASTPVPFINNFKSMNDDAKNEYSGTILNWKAFPGEKRW